MSFFGLTTSTKIAGDGTNPKSVLQYKAPTGVPMDVPEISVSGDGASPTAAKVEVEIVVGAATMTGTAINSRIVTLDSNNPTAAPGSAKEDGATLTGGRVVARELVHLQSGYTFRLPLRLAGDETVTIRTGPTTTAFDARMVLATV